MRLLRALVTSALVTACLTSLIPPRPAAAGHDNPREYPVIFLPGIGGSYLLADQPPDWCVGCTEWKIWISLGQVLTGWSPWSDLWRLRFNDDGTPAEAGIRLGEVIRSEAGKDIYDSYIRFLNSKGYTEENGWLSLFAYDFRYSIEQNAERLAQRVDEVLARTGAQKVILTTHSTGGLVARTYIVNTRGARVAGLIAIAAPWLGAAQATKAMDVGWDFGFGITYNPDITRQLTRNWPGAHGLAPGPQYLRAYPGGFYYYADTPPFWDHPQVELDTPEEQLEFQRSINPAIYDQVQAWRARIFNGQDYGVPTFVIAGNQGPESTLIKFRRWWYGGIEYKEDDRGAGDDTVPLRSALLGCSLQEWQNGSPCGREYIGWWTGVVIEGSAAHHGDLPNLTAVHREVETFLGQIECPQCTRAYLPEFTAYAGSDLTIPVQITDGVGRPLPNTPVSALLLPDGPYGCVCEPTGTTTDAGGWARFFFPYAGAGSAGTYRLSLWASPPGLHRLETSQTFPLQPARTGTVTGRITDAVTGSGVSGATVRVVHRVTGTVVAASTTGADGSYTIPNIPENSYRVTAEGYWYNSRELPDVPVTYGGTTTREIALTPLAPAVWEVTPSLGPAAGGNAVTLRGMGFGGSFAPVTAVRFGTAPAPQFTVISQNEIRAVAPAGTGTVDVTVTSAAGTSSQGAQARYAYAGALTGTVRNVSGDPVQGATITLLDGAGRPAVAPVTTPAGGSFAFPSLPPGTYTLKAEAPGYQALAQPDVLITSGRTATVDLVLSYPPVIGYVQARGRTLYDGVRITLFNAGRTYTATTDGTGAFTLTGVADGQYTLRAELEGYVSRELPVTVQGGAVTAPADGLRLTLLSGDLDQDGAIDLRDLGVLLGQWGRTGSFQDAAFAALDLLPDGRIDLRDLVRAARLVDLSPRVTLLAPAEGAQLTGLTQEVRFATRGQVVRYRILVNGAVQKESAVTAGGTFTETVTLTEGANTITVAVENASGRSGAATAHVTASPPAPLALVSPPWPAGGSITVYPGTDGVMFDGSVNLTATAPASATVTAQLNGQPEFALFSYGNGTFTGSVLLVNGTNTLVLSATDPLTGARTSLTYTITFNMGYTGAPGSGGGMGP